MSNQSRVSGRKITREECNRNQVSQIQRSIKSTNTEIFYKIKPENIDEQCQ